MQQPPNPYPQQWQPPSQPLPPEQQWQQQPLPSQQQWNPQQPAYPPQQYQQQYPGYSPPHQQPPPPGLYQQTQPNYPYSPQQPYPRKKNNSVWQWYRMQPRVMNIVLAAIVAIVVLSTIVLAFSFYSREKTARTPEATAVQSSPINTQQSQMRSPTPLPNTVSQQSLTLGGTEQAFINQYGQPTQTNNYNIDDYVNEKDDLRIGIDYVNTFSGNPSTYSVYFITVSTISGNAWTANKGKSICNSYLPTDAKYVKVVPSVKQTSDMGIILMYYSARLANTIPAGYFYDNNRQGVLPGTIYMEYSYQYLSDNSHIWMCALGTAQTSD